MIREGKQKGNGCKGEDEDATGEKEYDGRGERRRMRKIMQEKEDYTGYG